MMDEIVDGIDELGVLLMGHAKGAYWYGSRLSIDEARALAPHNNATCLQVTAAVLAGMIWAIENPRPRHRRARRDRFRAHPRDRRPYLGEVVGVYGDWTPLAGPRAPVPRGPRPGDPWQFKNFRVV